MGRLCTICMHAGRADIEAALDAGQPLRGVAADYGTSKTALHRHGQLHVAARPSSAAGTRYVKWGLVVAGILVLAWMGNTLGGDAEVSGQV